MFQKDKYNLLLSDGSSFFCVLNFFVLDVRIENKKERTKSDGRAINHTHIEIPKEAKKNFINYNF